MKIFLILVNFLIVMAAANAAPQQPVKLVVLGDSLTAGYGIMQDQAFPAQLEVALKERGSNVQIINGGIAGDIAAQGLARYDWTVGADIHALIIELGANDMLRGLPPVQAEAALDQILARAQKQNLPVLLAGMRAAPNLGTDYGQEFNTIYSKLAQKYNVLLYPFFLEGVVGHSEFYQQDGLHPNPKGVAEIVRNILPDVEKLILMVKNNHDQQKK